MKFFEPIECQTYMKNMKNSHFLKSCVKNKIVNLPSKKHLKHSLKRLEIQCSGKKNKKSTFNTQHGGRSNIGPRAFKLLSSET